MKVINNAAKNNQASYRNVMKATSIFGGVQVILIIISIIRSKFIALFLGASGLGVIGLLTSNVNLISALTNFGLATSAVREVAKANSETDENKVIRIISVLNKLMWFTGLLGTCAVILLSPLLSKFAFGNKDYLWAFVIISLSLLFNQFNAGKLVVLQGLQKVKFLAKSNLIGSVIGLLITLPIYYFFGNKGIAPSFVIIAVISFLVSRFFVNKINLKNSTISNTEAFREGKTMLKIGFMISLGGLLVSLSAYFIQIFIRKIGGVEQVGLFTAGFSIINVYVGLIFSAMSTDYFPRLSADSHNKELYKKTINQQAEIAILILGPILLCFIVFIKWVIILLYTNKFLAIESMISWAALGIFFKAASWSIGYLLLAKGNSKLFFWNELLSNCYLLILNISGYYFYGLEGLGFSFFLGYFIFLCQIFIVCKKYYDFSFDITFIKIFLIQFSLGTVGFFVIKFIANPFSHIIGILLIVVSCWQAFIELDKRLGIKNLIQNKFAK